MKMSIELNLSSPHKKPLAKILHAIAEMIEASSNQMISIVGTVTFEKCKDESE